jgi:thiol-disulfide isomerase/thioredoxin
MKTPVYVAVAIIAAGAGFGVYRYAIAPPSSAPVPMATDETPAAPPAEEEKASLPQILPDFTLADRDGQPRSIKSWQGKSMVVNFWATWCGPCRKEIPLLKELQQAHEAAGVQIVGVAVDYRDDVLKYAKEMEINYPILIGEQDGLDAVGKFGLQSVGFPFTVFTDNQGRIVSYHLGELTKAQANVLLAVVADVNSGKLTPEAARTVAAKQLDALPSPDA